MCYPQKALVEEAADKGALMDRKGGPEDQDIFPALLRVGEVGRGGGGRRAVRELCSGYQACGRRAVFSLDGEGAIFFL